MKTFPMLALLLALPLATSCENLPGSKEQQGAVAGGVGGAAAGAAIGESAFATILGGALGAGAGYLIGGQVDKLDDDEDVAEAREAAYGAQNDPATVEMVRRSDDADLNDDGFVTMDEVVAMSDAGLNHQEMLTRLERTGQVFDLTSQQEQELVAAGVDPTVVERLDEINQAGWRELENRRGEVISRRADT